MIKPYDLSRAMYFVLAAEARRAGIPFGGHLEGPTKVTPLEASDSGARIIDHGSSVVGISCWGSDASIEQCRPIAEGFRRNNTCWVPTVRLESGMLGSVVRLKIPRGRALSVRLSKYTRQFWAGAPFSATWLRDSARVGVAGASDSTSPGALSIVRQVDLPILAGTDVWEKGVLPGFSLHAELAIYVAEGLTPLAVLQSATLNPAKLLHATDSLGTVAPGKLADLILLDADPLTDITNTTAIRAVVANGRYLDRAALDRILAEVQGRAKRGP